MDYQELATLNRLLLELCNIQDSVTHMNGKGPRHEAETCALIAVRNGIRNTIVEFVERVTISGATNA